MTKYDYIIIGAGLGGLLSALILAKEGFKVAVLEQNKQIGGCLQTFSFDKRVFDSCVHYVGGLDEGQNLNRIFKYAGILDQLKLKRLDQDCFDEIVFGDEQESFPLAQGYESFISQLVRFFPNEKKSLQNYIQLLKKVGDSFPLYNLRKGDVSEKYWIADQGLTQVLQEVIPNPKLRNIILGNSLLYAGKRNQTPFYVHALVAKSYIDSSYRFVGGSSQISKLLWKELQKLGADVFNKVKITGLNSEIGLITAAIADNGTTFEGKNFIANVHPRQVLDWVDPSLLKPRYQKRVESIENSLSAFMVNIVLKPQSVLYLNRNIYWNRSSDSLKAIDQGSQEWPANYALYFSEDPKHPGFADTLAILTYDHFKDFEQWAFTHNRSAAASERTEDYQEYKLEKAKKLIFTVGKRYDQITENITSFKIATPLTFRDYMGTDDGSMYGATEEAGRAAQTQIPVKTKISNLLLTGQNVGLHGVLGVSISAIKTCSAILGEDYLLSKINQHSL